MSEIILPENLDKAGNDQPKLLAHESPLKKWGGLFVLSLGLAIIIIDTTLLNVSLATIIKDLNTDLKSIQWVITAYALMLAAFTITGGRIGDLFGRKKMFMLGAIIFALGSFMASESHALSTLLWGESIIEGLGAALMMPATASLVVANFKGKDRATAFGVWGGVAGASSAIGPLLGGYLTSHYSWRWGFRINVFVAALVIIGSLVFLSDSRDEEHRPQMDWVGVLLSALGLLGITYGVIESETYGWWKAREVFTAFGHSLNFGSLSITPICVAIGLLLLGLFLWWERKVEARGRQPLVSLSILKNRQFTSGSLTVMILTLGMTGLVFALPVFLQAVKGLDAFHTGLALLPLSGSLLVMAPIAGLLSRKISPTYLIRFGLAMTVVAMFILRWVINVDMPLWHLVPGLIIYGLGMGLVMSPISNLTLSAVPQQVAGEASGVNNTLRQVGATLGASIIGAAVLTSMAGYLSSGIQASQVIPEAAKPAIIRNVGSQGASLEFGQTQSENNLPAPILREIKQLVNQASTQSTRDGYVYAAMFLLLGFAVSLFLPAVDVHAHDEHGQHIVEESEYQHSRLKYIGAVALAIVAIGGAAWLLNRSSKQTISTGAVANASDIRQVFTNPDGSAQNFGAAAPLQTNTPNNNNSSAVAVAPDPFNSDPASAQTNPAQQVQGAQTGQGSVSGPSQTGNLSPRGEYVQPKPLNIAAPAVPQPTTFTSSTMGLEVQLPPAWQAKQSGDGKVALVSSGGSGVSIQAYDANGLTIEDIEAQLRGSPSVANLTRADFAGNNALQFQTGSQNGWALIRNNKLYYILGGSLSSPPLSSLKFL